MKSLLDMMKYPLRKGSTYRMKNMGASGSKIRTLVEDPVVVDGEYSVRVRSNYEYMAGFTLDDIEILSY